MLNKLMYWSPLPNKYDLEIFNKFRVVSYSVIVSTFVTAAAQGVVGAIGFIIIGLPAFLAGFANGILIVITICWLSYYLCSSRNFPIGNRPNLARCIYSSLGSNCNW